MSFLDKAKASVQQVAAQGQAKVQSIQQTRNESELFRALGEAYYNSARRGGDSAPIDAALQALDSHFAQVAQQQAMTPPPPQTPDGGAATTTTPGTVPPAPPPPPAPGAPGGF